MSERGVAVDHSTLNRWVITYAPEIEKQFRRRQRTDASVSFGRIILVTSPRYAILSCA